MDAPKLDNRRFGGKKKTSGLISLKFLMRYSDARFRNKHKQHESMDLSCRVSLGQVGAGGVMVLENIFLAHFGLLMPVGDNSTAYMSTNADHVHPFMIR